MFSVAQLQAENIGSAGADLCCCVFVVRMDQKANKHIKKDSFFSQASVISLLFVLNRWNQRAIRWQICMKSPSLLCVCVLFARAVCRPVGAPDGRYHWDGNDTALAQSGRFCYGNDLLPAPVPKNSESFSVWTGSKRFQEPKLFLTNHDTAGPGAAPAAVRAGPRADG